MEDTLTMNSSPHHHAHHFKSGDHELSTCKQGMWVFLVQEILFFSPLFVAYLLFRFMYYKDFHSASQHLDWVLGSVNTIMLIFSSFTMVRAITAAQQGQHKRIIKNLIFTFLLAGGFLIVKYIEYSHKVHVGTLPGVWFTNQELL